MVEFERRLEEAALNAWPAPRQLLWDGWVGRFADGYTKRANSVTPLYPSVLPLEQTIDFFERRYAEQQLPAIFRIAAPTAPAQLDATLEQRGYRLIDPSLVMVADVRAMVLPEPTLPMTEAPLDDWLPQYAEMSGTTASLAAHRAILANLHLPHYLGLLQQDDMPLACGMAVCEGDLLGLFDIMVHPQQRQHGYGTQLVAALLAWGQRQGAQWAYLQVIARNTVAQRLYQLFGFRERYRYWYRIREENRR